ncbi:hypothetical protein THERMOT_1621 [Bathymodiolus thermophilus thioautotrophic gill symbiont]|nr:hypothetical protein THERMOT_1621 [Bathymodiolus thermophilus thioautotrophic gill symbiont]
MNFANHSYLCKGFIKIQGFANIFAFEYRQHIKEVIFPHQL